MAPGEGFWLPSIFTLEEEAKKRPAGGVPRCQQTRRCCRSFRMTSPPAVHRRVTADLDGGERDACRAALVRTAEGRVILFIH